ncbi:zinc carboxypeptidase-like [Pectinophora gossypiella]|uniref:zinc carboxypeptidase-like n=1 Tax=Pectinophora gossypiella TaxID=13191 RepID=UPI00214EA4DF|nr:zinc carboxypeptidase-like [Pectinophora gossypiella]
MESLLVKFSLLYLFIQCVHTATVSKYKSYKDFKIYSIQNGNGLQRLIDTMKEFDESVFYSGNRNTTQILISPDLVPMFEEIAAEAKLETKLVVDDYSGLIEIERVLPPRKSGFSWNAYYDVNDIYRYLSNMSQQYPTWTELVVAGKSYEGRQILGLRINTPTDPDKPVMFIESGIHAREWITPATTTYFINQLLTSSDPDIIAMREKFDWHIFPTVNPDGYHHSYKYDRMWRKTRSKSENGCYGADPNRNWDYNWLKHGASNRPCDYQTYGGAKPFSEVETRTLSEYIAGLENLTGYIAFHSDAQMLLVPYSDSVEHIDNYDDLIQIGKTSLEYGYKVNKEKYDGPATAAEILYKASGGSMDWVRYSQGTPLVYTYELRGVYFHWPPWRISEQGDEVTQMMLGLVTEAQNLGYF